MPSLPTLTYRHTTTGNPDELKANAGTQRIGVFLVPGFSWMTFASLIEPMRQVNRLTGGCTYSWKLFSIDGAEVESSSGARIVVDDSLVDDHHLDYLFICAGVRLNTGDDARFYAWLRRAVRRTNVLGAVSTAPILLARAGLLDGYRCTLHWESFASFREQFPALNVTASLFEIDRDRITCSGATACLDLMLALIRDHYGHSLASSVADQFHHSGPRDDARQQRAASIAELRRAHPKLQSAIRLMEANLENPYSLTQLADSVFISRRQLERLFNRDVGTSVIRYYRLLRLRRAHVLLTQTRLSMLEVGLACGFRSMSQFSRDYRTHYGHPPVKERITDTPVGKN